VPYLSALKINGSYIIIITTVGMNFCKAPRLELPPPHLYDEVYAYYYMFNGLFSRTTWVGRHQKGKPFLDGGVAMASAGPYGNHLHLAPDR